MNRPIIEKEITEFGSIYIKVCLGKEDSSMETICFRNEMELKTFAHLLKMMLDNDAQSINLE